MRCTICCTVVFFASGSWNDPSKDVKANPNCKPSSVFPSIQTPKDVTELHPRHVKYSMAIGDSITAGALCGGGPVEYRQLSWSGGKGSSNHFTMPFLLNQYAPADEPLVGAAHGNFQWDQLAPCCGKAPWWSGIEADNDQLNAALSGAVSGDWELEVDHITLLASGGSFGLDGLGGWHPWKKAQQEHYKNSWKVLTVFFGMNDVLTTLDACSEDEEKRNAIVVSFRQKMTDLFDHLVSDKDGVFGKLYVNLVSLFRISYLGSQNAKAGWCELSGDTFLKGEFPCMRSGGDLVAKGKLIDEVTNSMNLVVEELAASYNQKRPDFGVNLVRTLENSQITHEDLRSPLDCFHPTAIAQRIMGTGLWNAMLAQSHPLAIDDVPRMPECADADTRLVTYKRKTYSEFVMNATVVV